MAFDRRREKSFGEPTRVRTDGTVGSTKDGDLPKKPANTAYERYKQELHAFFSGEKPLPANLKDMLATRPGAAEHGLADEAAAASAAEAKATTVRKKDAKDAKPEKAPRRVINGPSDDVLAIVEQIRRANSPREVEAAVDALRSKGASLPKDAEVLSKALGHGNEEVLAEALKGLVEIPVAQIKSPGLLKTRVKNVLLLASTTDVKDLGQKLLARLG